MVAVIFEVRPRTDKTDAYLGIAKMLRPELERIDGFVDNIRYRSLTRDGWILSLSSWQDEKAVVRWRTHAQHHEAQEKGRAEIFAQYRLRVGQLTSEGADVTLIDATSPSALLKAGPDAIANWLGFASDAAGLVAWDVFDAVLRPGDAILLLSWRTAADADAFERVAALPVGARLRHVRVIRDYGMFDRREAPQYYPDAPSA